MLALAVAGVFVHLGLWQSGRAREKQRMIEAVDAVLASPVPGPLAQAHDSRRARTYAWAAGHGRFTGPPLWLDNQQREGRVGVRGFRVFQPVGAAPLLVDIGWAPIAPDRRALPAAELPRGEVEVRGLLSPPPSAGIAVGEAMAPQGDAWLMLRVEPAAITRALRLQQPLAPRVLRLDPALGFGLPRDLALLANTLPPDKHRGYALQWFALAATVIVVALVLTFRTPRP
jgi:cytochrome oxidase assembly protein ShyY1